jgi:hypothetical protein
MVSQSTVSGRSGAKFRALRLTFVSMRNFDLGEQNGFLVGSLWDGLRSALACEQIQGSQRQRLSQEGVDRIGRESPISPLRISINFSASFVLQISLLCNSRAVFVMA